MRTREAALAGAWPCPATATGTDLCPPLLHLRQPDRRYLAQRCGLGLCSLRQEVDPAGTNADTERRGDELRPGRGCSPTWVAISADGNTALIGAPADSNGTTYGGAVWVFVRSGSTWTQQGARLAASDEGLYTGFGNSIALSANGTTALISGGDGNTTAQAWVFVRSRTTWSQQAVLTSDAHYEGAEALSSNGNTAIITGPTGTAGSLGAAWVFVRSGSTWKQQGPRLMGSGETSKSVLGEPRCSLGTGTRRCSWVAERTKPGCSLAMARPGNSRAPF